MWCCRRTEEISCTNQLKNEVLHRVTVERNIIPTINLRKANWIGQFLRRNCHLNQTIEGKKGREDEEGDVISYWMIFSERKDTGI